MNLPLQKAIGRILSPLSRLLIGRGVTYGMACELLKTALIKEAAREFEKNGTPTNDSRISIITGVHRKDIKRLKMEPEHQPPSKGIPVTTQVISAWLGNQELRDVNENLLPIPKKRTAGHSLNFEDLVMSISKDVRPRAVLDELIDRKVLRLREDDTLEIDVDHLLTNQDETTTAEFMGMNIHDHLSVAVDNYLRKSLPQLERNVFYQGLSDEAAEQLAQSAEKFAMQALLNFNEEAQKIISDKKNHGHFRVNFGTYFFRIKKMQDVEKEVNS